MVATYNITVTHPKFGKRVLPIGWSPHQPIAAMMVEGAVGCPYPKCWRVFTKRLRTYKEVENRLQKVLQGHLDKDHA